MNSNALPQYHAALKSRSAALLAICMMLAACAAGPKQSPAPVVPPAVRFDGAGPVPTLAYYQMLSHMSPAELGRERSVLAALPQSPNTQLRMAMLLGYSRTPQDIGKAIALLDLILKSNEPAAVSLQPLARLLTDNYLERQRQEFQIEKQVGQLKESQKKAAELQEKIDGLADIERTLPQRNRASRATPVRGAK